jgi:hypothetical protein
VAIFSAALTASASAATTPDALHRKVTTQLTAFTSWLKRGGASGHGYVGEVGWPGDDARWNELAAGWYRQADQHWLWVSAWSAGDAWPPTYPLRIYGGGQVGPQAAVVEAQAPRKRSVDMSGAEFGTPPPLQPSSDGFSNARPGVAGVDYTYPTPDAFASLARRGITMVRLPFRWERIQPVVRGPLDPNELGRLTAAIDAAASAGIGVVLDVHNYGAYWQADANGTGRRSPISPSGEVRVDAFADLWSRLSTAFAGRPGVVAYDLMNEPVALPGGASTWETASQAAVSAIRARRDTTQVMVEAYDWSGPTAFPKQHPKGPWIRDATGRTFYEAHQYFDCDGSGKYHESYDDAVSCAAAEGY